MPGNANHAATRMMTSSRRNQRRRFMKTEA
jgi:hypothetical protein